jgi:hypothetical protein
VKSVIGYDECGANIAKLLQSNSLSNRDKTTQNKSSWIRHRFLAIIWPVLALLCAVEGVQGQAGTKVYRGSVGDKHVEMKLTFDAGKAKGTYTYDQFRQDLQLEGTVTAPDKLELFEGQGKKKTGRFVCKKQSDAFDIDYECEWSRSDNTGQAFVVLREQFQSPSAKLKIVPKVIVERKSRTSISLPQISATPATPSINAFNSLIESVVQRARKEFSPETPERGVYDLNYLVLWASDDLVSVELEEYADSGGAHPNTRLRTVNYSLTENRQLTLDDVFKKDSNYESVIAQYVTRDINRRADQMDQDDARSNNRPVEKRDEPVMAEDRLPEIDAWAMRPDGLAVYFDFPHVMAVFDKTVIPYTVVRDLLKPDGVATQFAKP